MKLRQACLLIVFILGAAASAEAQNVEYTGAAFPDPFIDKNLITTPSNTKNQAVVEEAQGEEKVVSSMTVQGVYVSGDGNLAIVNGKVVRVGDSLLGFKVAGIDSGGVRLENRNRKSYNLAYKKRMPL